MARFAVVGTLSCASSDGVAPEDRTQIVAVSPAANLVGATVAGFIVIRFDRPLERSSVDATDVRAFGRWSGVHDGNVELAANGTELRFSPTTPFAAGELITVSIAANSVVATDGAAFARGFAWSFWTGVERTSVDFTHVATVALRRPGEGRIRSYGAYAGDLDHDGFSDLVVPNEDSNDIRILLNDGTGRYTDFSVTTVPQGGEPSTNEGADFDGDGEIDFAVGSARGRYAALYRGDGMGGLDHYADLDVGQAVRALCVLDFEGDGDVDIAAAAYDANHVALFTNDGAGGFTLTQTVAAGGGAWSCATGDANGDGLHDLFIGFRTRLQVAVFVSEGDGAFTESGRVAAGGDPWMLTAGDMNNDGHVDVVASNAVTAYVSVLLGDGNGGLSLFERYPSPGFLLAADIGDVDGDRDLDVVVSNFESRKFDLFLNDGTGRLTRASTSLLAPDAASCAILHDRDADGDLDLTGIDELADEIILFDNR